MDSNGVYIEHWEAQLFSDSQIPSLHGYYSSVLIFLLLVDPCSLYLRLFNQSILLAMHTFIFAPWTSISLFCETRTSDSKRNQGAKKHNN